VLRNTTKKVKGLHEDLETFINKDTILIGHSLENDLHAMKLIHENVIDTSVLFARKNGSKLKLKTLAFQLLDVLVGQLSDKSRSPPTAPLRTARQPSTSRGRRSRTTGAWFPRNAGCTTCWMN
jgi:hypothetical protein